MGAHTWKVVRRFEDPLGSATFNWLFLGPNVGIHSPRKWYEDLKTYLQTTSHGVFSKSIYEETILGAQVFSHWDKQHQRVAPYSCRFLFTTLRRMEKAHSREQGVATKV